MNKLLNDEVISQVKNLLDQGMKESVQVLFFGRKTDCDFCEDTQQLLEEVTALSDKIALDIYDIDEHAEVARQYHVDKVPGVVFAARNGDQIIDYGIRLAGIPSGHEFTTLIHDLILVSGRDSGLNQKTRDFLKSLPKPVNLMVFITPTCPYCPRAVLLAHQMAMESPLIEAEMIEAMEFTDLSDQHQVSGVPQTTINHGAGTAIGAVPEEQLVKEIQRALEVS